MFVASPLDKSVPESPNRYYKQIIKAINDAVLSGDLKEGERLPSERELADIFETSRVPVREAIKVLEFCGIIGPIPGGGFVVKSISISELLYKLQFSSRVTDDTLKELFEVRLLLESFAARRAANNRTQGDLDEMQAAIDQMQADIQAGHIPDEGSQRFHMAVTKAAGNSVVEDIYKFLYTMLETSRMRTLADQEQQSSSLMDHRRILASISAGNAGEAEANMEAHLKREQEKLNHLIPEGE